MPVTEIPKLHCQVKEQFKETLHKPKIVFTPSFIFILVVFFFQLISLSMCFCFFLTFQPQLDVNGTDDVVELLLAC